MADEALGTFLRYLQVNTSNPPGNEIAAARFWKEIFDREGIECVIVGPPAPSKRANVVARLPGKISGRALVLLHHLDVVPAEARRWRYPPFAAEIAEGAIWGRGATDMKALAVAQAWSLIDLKRRGVVPARDLIFIGTADEETGRENGAEWILANRPDLVQGAEALLTEGSPARRGPDGTVESFAVVATEKAPLWLRITALGATGHAAIPDDGSAPSRLLGALCRLENFRSEATITPAARRFFAQLADREPEPAGPLFRDLDTALASPAFRARLMLDPVLSAMLHDTCQVTGLASGGKINVIPAEASAEIDCRLLPGQSPQVFLSRLKVVSGDPDLVWEVLASASANASPLDTDLVRTIERTLSARVPGIRIETPILTASTDAHLFREAGLLAYGFDPFPLSDDEDRAHGTDERMPLSSFRLGFDLYRAIVEAFVLAPVAPRGSLAGGGRPATGR